MATDRGIRFNFWPTRSASFERDLEQKEKKYYMGYTADNKITYFFPVGKRSGFSSPSLSEAKTNSAGADE